MVIEPHDIKSVDFDPTVGFYFEGIPQINLTNVSRPELDQLIIAVKGTDLIPKTARALWNPKVCGTNQF